MVQQTGLPFNYVASTTSGATALAGLPLYLELARVLDLRQQLATQMPARGGGQGWSDADVVLPLVLLNLAGGESVSDLDLLRRDEGFVRIARAVACVGLPRKEARAKARLLAKAGEVPMPSASTVFRFLQSFHGPEQEVERTPGTAVLVPEHARLRGLWQVVASLLTFMQQQRPRETVTLDADATLVETHKSTALHCYKGYKAYQPLNFYVAEWGMIAYSHFRDGNVPCGMNQLSALQRALELLPAGIKKVKLRMDTQGYEWELLRWLGEGKSERFGVIEFAVGADMTQELKKEIAKLAPDAWKELPRAVGEVAQQWAEVCFVPNASGTSKNAPTYRFIATREVLAQQPLPGIHPELPFPTMEFGKLGHCKLHAIVTNTKLTGPELVTWYRQRCGKSEEAHSVMKSDLAGGRLPSGDFGANAAWWTIMLLALNLNELLKRLAMGAEWVPRRLKAIRAHVICVAARVVEHARQVVVRLGELHPSTAFIQEVRERILALVPEPSG
jgi:hypothetical protein